MKEEDCKVGNRVRITQPTTEVHKVGKILGIYSDGHPIYYTIEGLVLHYQADQMELVEASETIVINNYQIY